MFPRALYWLSDWLADVGFFLFRSFRNRSTDNIRVALGADLDGPVIEDIARGCLRNFFRACVEIGAAIKSTDQEMRARIPVVGRENIDAALAKSKGVLILSAHLGNFFLIGSRLAIEGIPTFVLVNQPRDGRFAELMDQYRLQVRQKTIHARPRRMALQELNDVLRGNQAVVMIADEYRKGSGIEVSLFGRAVIARRGPVTLALRTGAAIVPACMVRQPDNSLKLIIEPELKLERTIRGKAQIRDNTILITQWLERTVRAYPDQWNWMNVGRWGRQTDHPIGASEPVRRAS
jgi:KDO2-lipid IV(A) lauroyltransferase